MATLVVPPVVQLSVVFRCRHEVDLSEWTTTTGSGISRAAPGLASTLGKLKINVTDTSARVCEKTLAITTDHLRYRFYVDHTALTMASGDSFVIHQVRLTGGIPTLFQLALSYNGSAYSLTPTLWADDGSSANGSPITLTAGEHWVEVHLARPADASSADGVAAVYVDNVESGLLVGDFYDLWAYVAAFRLGAISGLDAGTAGALYFDEVVATDRAKPIGPTTFNRAELKAFDYEVQLLAGPPRAFLDMTAIDFGGAFTVPAATALTADLAGDDDHAHVADASTFASAGGAFVLAHATGEVNEYLSFGSKTATSLDELTRYVGGFHETGAAVEQWVDVTAYVTGMSLNWNRQGNTVTWEATLKGQNYNSGLFRRDNAIMALVRFNPAGEGGGWTDWKILFCGFITGKDVDDDYRRAGNFSLKVEGVQAYLRGTSIDAQRFGRTNLAEGRPAQASSTLKDMLVEATSGEFSGAPSAAAGNAVDGNPSTLWISDVAPTLTPDTPGDADYVKITEVYPRHLVGSNHADYQWFEVRFGDNMDKLPLVYEFRYLWTSMLPYPGLEIFRNQSGGVAEDSVFIFCVNRKKFEETFSLGKNEKIVEVGRQLFNPAGDFCMIIRKYVPDYYPMPGGGKNPYPRDLVRWGADAYNGLPGNYGQWTGPAVALPDEGHSIRRSPTMSTDTETAADWVEDEYPLPGLHTATGEWISVELPAMTATLSAQLAQSYTAYVEVTNLDGLTESGRIQIALEQIDYTSLDRVNSRIVGLTRGVAGTSDVAHNAGVAVKQVEGGVATDNLRISSVAWRRRMVYNGATLVVPKDFSVWVSTVASPTYPSGSLPGAEWTRLVVASGWTDAEWTHQFPAIRARHVLLYIRKMSDGGRAKVNEMEVYEATTSVGGVVTTAEFSDTEAIVRYVLETQAGLDTSEVDVQDATPFTKWPTAKSNALALLDDLARRTNCLLVCELDGRVSWAHDPMYSLAVLPEISAELGRDSGIKVSMQWEHGRDTSQVIVHARDSQSGQQFEGTFPPVADILGDSQMADDVILGSAREAQLLAELMYRQAKNALSGTIDLSGSGEDPLLELPLMRPGSRIALTWLWDEAQDEVSNRNFLVEGVHLSANFGDGKGEGKTWETSLSVREYLF